MQNLQKSYENWMDGRLESDLDKELTEQLKKYLPEEIFEEVFNKMSDLQAQHEEEAFRAGYIKIKATE